MTDTEIVDEILHILRLSGQGRFSREDIIPIMEKVIPSYKEHYIDHLVLESYFDDEDLDKKRDAIEKNQVFNVELK